MQTSKCLMAEPGKERGDFLNFSPAADFKSNIPWCVNTYTNPLKQLVTLTG